MGSTRKRGRDYSPGIVEIWRREVGGLAPRIFAHRFGASQDLVLRLGIHRKLEKHRGCVNTVSFNSDGNILVSGSDDRMVILWDWDVGKVKLNFHSGHRNNVFQAKFMPYSEDRSMVTCAADGEVRHAQILEGGQVKIKMLAQHDGRAHKIAIEPGSPHIFYSCGEDGLVQHFDLRTDSATQMFICKPVEARRSLFPFVQLNAIALDPRNPNHLAMGGSEVYARLYDIRKYKWDASTDQDYPIDYFCPSHIIDDEQIGITGLAFSDQSELLLSYHDELIYLFSKDQGLGPNTPVKFSLSARAKARKKPTPDSASPSTWCADPKHGPQSYEGHCNSETVKGVSFFGPNCEYVVSGSDCGRIFIWRKKDGGLLRVMEGDKQVVNCIEPHPYSPIMASSGIESDTKIWIPNADKPAPPVNMEELKRKNSTRFRRSPQDILTHILGWQIEQLRSGQIGNEVTLDGDLVDLIMRQTNDEASSDESGATSADF